MGRVSKGKPVLQSLMHAMSKTAKTLLIRVNVWKCVMLGNFLDDLKSLEFARSFEVFFVCFASIVCFPLYSNLLYCFWEENFPRTAVILDHREEATFSIKVWGNNQGWCWGYWFGKHKNGGLRKTVPSNPTISFNFTNMHFFNGFPKPNTFSLQIKTLLRTVLLFD